MGRESIILEIRKEIERLKKLGHSQRKVATILGIDKNTVNKYWNGFLAAQKIIPPIWANDLDWIYIEKELKNKVKKKILYNELSEFFDLPSYVSFSEYLKKRFKYLIAKDITIKIHRIPGEAIEIDYAGDSISIIIPSTGEIIHTELFVAALSYSGLFYAEFTYSQKLEDFIASHGRMFIFFGGVAKFLIPDNLKSAVTKANKIDPLINKTYHDMCSHYNTTADPADSRSPRHKPNVEAAVKILQNGFFQEVRKETFTSLFELNKRLKKYIVKKNNEIMKDRGASRITFFQKEKQFLKPLPASIYELYYFKQATLHQDCHFQFDRNYYSTPYKFVGKKLDIKYNSKMVHAFFETERVSSHKRLKGHGHYSTNDYHYPENKIVEMGIVLCSIRRQAKIIGKYTAAIIEKLIKVEKHPLKNLRKMQGILGIAKKHSSEEMEHACEMALEHNKLFYQFIKSCAKNYQPKNINKTEVAPNRQLEFICLQGGVPNGTRKSH